MTRPPDFDELVGDDVSPEEAARLRRAHELLVAAGPAPELPPSLEQPRLGEPRRRLDQGMFHLLPRRRVGAALALAAAIALVAFLGGYLAGYSKDQGTRFEAVARVTLSGTAHDPGASAVVLVGRRDAGGNLPMLVTVRGLKALPPSGYYTLALLKNGKPVVTCGTFRVRANGARTTVRMAVAYDVSAFDGWVVTEYRHGRKAEPIMLRS